MTATRTTTTIHIPPDRFAVIDTTRGGHPAVVVLNETVAHFAHREVFPWHLRIVVDAAAAAFNGMPTAAETKVLDDVDQRIEHGIAEVKTSEGSQNTLFVGRITWDGKRELNYRIHDPDLAAGVLTHLLELVRTREWNYEMFEDPAWDECSFVSELLQKALS